MNILDFIRSLNSVSKDILYFGGSFNPWHEGHSECLRKAPKNVIKIVIPDHNPLKDYAERSLGVDEDYVNSLNENIYVYKGFFEQKTTNPTIDWILPLSKNLENYTHSLLIGYDSYESLYKWKGYKLLLSSLNKLYVLNRQNSSNEKLYEIETVFLGSHSYESESSTSIREKSLQK